MSTRIAIATRATRAGARHRARPRRRARVAIARRVVARATTTNDADDDDDASDDANDALKRVAATTRGKRRRAESTDAVATFMTRRFGLKGGLAWLGALTFGVLSEQLKTRRETREAIENTEDVRREDLKTVELPSGVTYVEYTRGGGARAKAVPVRGETARARGFGGGGRGVRVRHGVGGKGNRVVVRREARTAVVSRVRGRRRRDATGRATRRARAGAIGVRERRRGFSARR